MCHPPWRLRLLRLLKNPSLDPNVFKNFRTVFNQPFPSKLLERIALFQLFDHLERNDLWHNFQSAYWPHHKTQTTLLPVLMMTASDSNQVLTLLGLSATFDTIVYRSLYFTTFVFSITGTTLSSFIFQIVPQRKIVSCFRPWLWIWSISCFIWCPTGLSPRFCTFILYTQPLSDIIKCHMVSHHMFADDTELYQSVACNDVQALLSRMQSCIAGVKLWTTHNKLLD